jgi:uncharacterized protein (TIGR03435 family)
LQVAKGGPKLKPSEQAPQYANDEERQQGMQKQMQATMAMLRVGGGVNNHGLSMGQATLEKFADNLARNLDRPVKDLTQLPGEYSFHLTWTPDSEMKEGSSGVSLFTAIQEQLGLKLESGSEPMEWVVVEKVEKVPTSN